QRLPRTDGRAAARARGRRGVVERGPRGWGLLRAAERIALGQRLDPAAGHARVPRVDPALLRHVDPLADVSFAVAEDEPDAVRAAGRGRLRERRTRVSLVRRGVPPRARALPRLLRERRDVSNAARA